MKKLILSLLIILVLTGCNKAITMDQTLTCNRIGEESATGFCDYTGFSDVKIIVKPFEKLVTLYGTDISNTFNLDIQKDNSTYRLTIVDEDVNWDTGDWSMAISEKDGKYVEKKLIHWPERPRSCIFISEGICTTEE